MSTRVQTQWEPVIGQPDGKTMIRCPNLRFTPNQNWVRCGSPIGFVDGGTTVHIRGVVYGKPQISPPGTSSTTHACHRCKESVQVRRDSVMPAMTITPGAPKPLSPAA